MPVQREIGLTPDKLDFLSAHLIFQALGPDLVKRLSTYAKPRTIRRGTLLFSKGDPGNSLFAIRKGAVRISSPTKQGKSAVLNLIHEGEILGEIALLDGGPRTADATAVTDCELTVIDRRDFLPLVRNHPDVAIKLIELLCSRLRRTSEQVEDVLFMDLPSRLARTLLRLAAGSNGDMSGRLAITQLELSQVIGMSRESTNKQLREWAQRKWIRLDRGGVLLLVPDALSQIAGELNSDRTPPRPKR
jgi:CRP/FNR family cyclic AMP-dependent transcriptional regulator